MPEKYPAKCKCCGLTQEFTERVGSDPSAFCATCRQHQSPHIEQRLKLHQEHEAMLRVRLNAADTWARRVEAENKDRKQDVFYAYRTRDRAADLLQKINDIHTMRPDGTCSCGIRKGCPTADVIYKRFAQMLIKRVDDAQEELRRQQERMRELEALGDYGEEYDWVRETAYGPDITRRDDAAG